MRFLLVDRILEWTPDNEIRGVKNVAMSEDHLEYHFPDRPVMPGVLLLETMVQLAGWLEAVSSDFARWFLLDTVVRCRFYGLTLPGDQMVLEIQRVAGQSSGRGAYSGIGWVDQEKRVTAELEGDIVALGELEDPDRQRRVFELLTRGRSL